MNKKNLKKTDINIQYKILYKNAVKFNAIPKHMIPTKEDWVIERTMNSLRYKYFLDHITNIDNKLIKKILIKNHFFEYIKFLELNY